MRHALLLILLLLTLPSASWGAMEKLDLAPRTNPNAALRAELATHFATVFADEERLARWRDTYLHHRRGWLERSLKRAARLQPRFQTILEELGVPRVLGYLPMIESGFQPHATSVMAAGGYWQFIPSTARRFGLTLDPWVDERRDPEISTRAAGRYLKRLHNTFHDWPLALMAYNSGEGRILGILKRLGSRDYHAAVRSAQLPEETVDYVTSFVAAVQIALDPEGYGVTPPATTHPPETTVVKVRGSVDLAYAASAMAMKEKELRSLNPALLQSCTPPQKRGYPLRVPTAAAEALRGQLASDPNALSTHLVARPAQPEPEEAPGAIARLDRLPMVELSRFNPLHDPRRIRAGAKLVVSSPADQPLPAVEVQPGNDQPSRLLDYRRLTSPGPSIDPLWSIATRYGTNASSVPKWHGLVRRELTPPGDELTPDLPKGSQPTAPGRSPAPTRLAAATTPSSPDYRVVANDTLWSIASRHGLTVEALAAWNGLAPDDTLHSGQILHLKPLPFLFHRVGEGESLWQIAKQYRTTVQKLRRHNHLDRGGVIHPGDRLKIPTASGV